MFVATARFRGRPWLPMLRELRFLVRRRHLLFELIRNNLRTMYTDTVLGGAWWFICPLLDALVYYFLVTVIFCTRADNFPLFILCAIFPWRCFVGSVKGAMTTLQGHRRLLEQVRFPRSVLVVSVVAATHAHFLFTLPVLIGLQLWYGIMPTWCVIGVVPLLLAQVMLALGLGLVMSCLHVHFRDLATITDYALTLLFFVSPGIYGVDRVSPELWRYYRHNPFCTVFAGMRDCFMRSTWPSWSSTMELLVVAAVALVIGFWSFCRLERGITKVL